MPKPPRPWGVEIAAIVSFSFNSGAWGRGRALRGRARDREGRHRDGHPGVGQLVRRAAGAEEE